jgi:hypothetical protein
MVSRDSRLIADAVHIGIRMPTLKGAPARAEAPGTSHYIYEIIYVF